MVVNLLQVRAGGKSRGFECDICQEVVESTPKTFPCSDGELCGFNCGQLCQNDRPKISEGEKNILANFDNEKPAPNELSPCLRGQICSRGAEHFMRDPKIRNLVNILMSCNVKPYAICSALKLQFPGLNPTCDSKSCRNMKGEISSDQCHGERDYEVMTSSMCEKDMNCPEVKSTPIGKEPVTDNCYVCYWIVKSWPIFQGDMCGKLNGFKNFPNSCKKFYDAYMIDSDDVLQLVPSDAGVKEDKDLDNEKVIKGLAKATGEALLQVQELFGPKSAEQETDKALGDIDKEAEAARKKNLDVKCKQLKDDSWLKEKCQGGLDKCKLEKCRGEGSPPLLPDVDFENCTRAKKASQDEQIDTCYELFQRLQFSVKARALISNIDDDPSAPEESAISSPLAVCMCLGMCPFTGTEGGEISSSKCGVDLSQQANNMEEMTASQSGLYFPSIFRNSNDFTTAMKKFRFPELVQKHLEGWRMPTSGLELADMVLLDNVKGLTAYNDKKADDLNKKCPDSAPDSGGKGSLRKQDDGSGRKGF